MHEYHDGLPGYSADQIFHDGCGECETRAASLDGGIAWLDKDSFPRAWARAAQWDRGSLPDMVARAEVPVLRILWSVQVQLEQFGCPIGLVPSGWQGPADE
jgi:hypothetical protein